MKAKKLLAFALALCMILCNMPMTGVRSESVEIIAGGTCGDNLTWKLDENGVLSISGEGEMEAGPWFTEESYFWHDWEYAWKIWSDDIETIVISDGITSIAAAAFADCYNVCSITIPDSITSIGAYAFLGCSSLLNITIPGSVTSIGNSAFFGCGCLTNVTIPASVTVIGNGAFANCTALETIVVDADNPNYSSQNGVLFDKEKTRILVAPGALAGDYVIPDTVTRIENSAFSGCGNLTSITFHDAVERVGEQAFAGCEGLTAVYISDLAAWYEISFDLLGYGAGATRFDTTCNPLYYAGNLYLNGELVTEVTISAELGVADCVFAGCDSLVSVTILDGVTCLGGYAFAYCSNLTEVVIPDSVKEIGCGVFEGCKSLKSVTIPDGVTLINLYTFLDCESLQDITIPNSVTLIREMAFKGCDSLTSVTIPNSVTEIEGGAFEECEGLISVIIPNSVSGIESYMFSGCTNLTYVIIPDSVMWIGIETFYGCTALEHVLYQGTEEQWSMVEIYWRNEPLTEATYHYNSTGDEIVDGECIICNPPYVIGDMDGNDMLDTDDAIYLLYYTLFGEDQYPIGQGCDFNGNGMVDTDDAIYLLYHTLFGDSLYPLN